MEKLKVLYDNKNILVAVLVAMLLILSVIIVNLIFSLTSVQILLMNWVLTTAYALFAFFIIDSPIIRQIESEKIINRPFEVIREVRVPFEKKVIQIVEKEVIKEVPIQIPIENRTVEVVEKEVIREVPVYITSPTIRRKLTIPRYKYLASLQTKRYHKRNCRFAKLIKKKFKLHNNSPAFFKKKHFKACKICIKKQRKF
jgi:hypothetical protein